MFHDHGYLQVEVSVDVIELNKGIHATNVTPTINGTAMCTVDQMSPNKNLC